MVTREIRLVPSTTYTKMLRSRSGLGATLQQPPGFTSDLPHLDNKTPLAGYRRRWRMRIPRIRTFAIAVIILLLFAMYMRLRTMLQRLSSDEYLLPQNRFEAIEEISRSGLNQEDTSSKNKQGRKKTKFAPSSAWKYPLVDRSILNKLDRMERFFAQDYYAQRYPPHTPAQVDNLLPLVTHIPERAAANVDVQIKAAREAICDSAKHPRPCRFLLPLRIAEQESKARIHFTQIVRVARELNRTLVLPNVGKSKIGACFKWSFGTYYDVGSLKDGLDDTEWFVKMEDFKAWIDREENKPITSQLVSVASSLPANAAVRKEKVLANEHVVVHAYEEYDAWKKNLPGCFLTRFPTLDLEDFPMLMSTTYTAGRDANDIQSGRPIIEAFSAITSPISHTKNTIFDISIKRALPPESNVLVVNWDLRYPVFSSLPIYGSLHYSRRMREFASRYAPTGPYLVVQWRMETVDPEVLNDCAHTLVDVLSRLLHDDTQAANITTIWFASDYPYPIARRSKSNSRPALVAKSGTFKDFEVQHEEAVEILRRAFDEHNELERRRLTDFAEAMEAHGKDIELMQDSGVLGILDKLISINAAFFVSGSSHCSRRSSFTKQVIDARIERSRSRDADLGNVVDTFG